MNNSYTLRQLIELNPELPIVPMVSATVAHSGYDYTVARLGRAEVKEYALIKVLDEYEYITKEDLYRVRCWFFDEAMDDGFTVEEAEQVVQNKLDAIEWIKAIVVYIEEGN